MGERLTDLLDSALAGNQRDLARLITAVENGDPGVLDLLDRCVGLESSAHVLGVTGPPGSGKSTLVDRLVTGMRAADERVAVLLVDPSSPFSGGAVLGDRIRMQHHTTDPGVFIRSLGSRGHQGGLTRATDQVLLLLRVAGFDRVVLETVGVGQTELQVMDLADTVLVVLVPEAGDSIQAMKAGLMEIADLFTVNKADRPGAERLVLELEQSVRAAAPQGWSIPVLAISALQEQGLEPLADALEAHRKYRVQHAAPTPSARDRLAGLLEQALRERLRQGLNGEHDPARLAELLQELDAGGVTPFRAARRLLDDEALLAVLLGIADEG